MIFPTLKKILIICSLFFCTSILFAQEESFDDFEDFDSLFDDVEEDVVVEEKSVIDENPLKIENVASMLKFSGSMTSDVGLAMIINDDVSMAGYFDFENNLNMKVRPNNKLSLNGSVQTSLTNKFSIALSYLYFDYLIFDKIYLSAGKKESLLGGYTRLFEHEAIKQSSKYINIDLRYPWSTGTLTFLGSYNLATGSTEPKAEELTFGGALEQTIGHTSVNIFGKKYGKYELVGEKHKNPVVGVEVKRSILGFDTYVQGITSIANIKHFDSESGYESLAVTGGLYRLWDANDPNFGFNVEYRYVWTPAKENINSHFMKTQAGIKRMGKKKNLKIGLETDHNLSDASGTIKLAFIIGDLFPYANWSNGIEIGYSKEKAVEVKIASLIQISLDY